MANHGADETSADAARARLSDALVRCGGGDRAALDDVYQRTSAKLFGLCLRILPDRAEAEDALQDAFVTIWQKADRYDPERASPISWLAALTRNKAIDRLRRRGGMATRPIEDAQEIADPGESADALLMRADEARRLHDCLRELEARDVGLIRGAFFQGSTYSELAARAAEPLGTVKSRIRRALIRLKGCLSS